MEAEGRGEIGKLDSSSSWISFLFVRMARSKLASSLTDTGLSAGINGNGSLLVEPTRVVKAARLFDERVQ